MISRISNAYRQSFVGLSRQTWLLSVVMLVNRAGTMAIPFLGIYATQVLGRSLKDAGLLITLFGLGSIAGASLGGWLTDRIGFRPVQVISFILSGILFLFIPHIQQFGYLCGHVVILAIVAEAVRPANYAAIAAYALPGTMTRSYSLNRLAINLGWAIGGAMGGFLASFNYALLYYVDGSTNILAGILVAVLLSQRISKKPGVKTTRPPKGMKIASPWQDGWFLRFLGMIVIFNTCFFLLFRLVPIFWKEEWHLGERQIGLLLGLNGFIIAIMEMVLVNRWEKRNKPFRYMIAGTVAVASAFAILMMNGTSILILMGFAAGCVVLLTLGEMLAMPFMNSTCMQRANQYNRGKYAAGYTLSWSVAQVVGPAGGAWIAETFSYNTLWLLLIVLLGFAAFGISKLATTYLPTEELQVQNV